MSAQWPFTNLGIQFFQGQLPQLIRNIGRLADELKRYNDEVEARKEAHERFLSDPRRSANQTESTENQ